MYKKTRHVTKFDADDADSMKEYADIVANPLCTILESRKFRKSQSEYDEGKIVSSSVTDYILITWEERELL